MVLSVNLQKAKTANRYEIMNVISNRKKQEVRNGQKKVVYKSKRSAKAKAKAHAQT